MTNQPSDTRPSAPTPQTPVPILSKLSYCYDRSEPKPFLSTLELRFTPKTGEHTSLPQTRRFGSDLFEYYKRPLDLIYADLPDGDCHSYARDGHFHIVTFGYKYASKPCELSKKKLAQYATTIFNLHEYTIQNPNYCYVPLTAELSSNHGTAEIPSRIPDVEIDLRLHPILNHIFLEYTKKMPLLEHSASALDSLNNLQSLLETTSQPTIKYLFSIIPKRPKPSKRESIPF